MKISTFEQCRVCGSRDAQKFLSFSRAPLTDQFIPLEDVGSEFVGNLDVHVCKSCWTAQTLQDLVGMDDYYDEYAYTVSGSAFAASFMDLLAETIIERFGQGRKRLRVLEIGSGDGGQLRFFADRGHDVLGVEPSNVLARRAVESGIPTLECLFDADTPGRIPADFLPVDIVTMSYTMDHIPTPMESLAAIQSILEPNRGVLVVENHDFCKIVDRLEYCLFEHEHSIYLTPHTARGMLERAGMKLVDVNWLPENRVRANSLIFAGACQDAEVPVAVSGSLEGAAFESAEFYKDLQVDIQRAIDHLDEFVREEVAAGRSVCGYGAGGRGVMTLAAMQESGHFQYVADRSPRGRGFALPGSGVRLVGLEDMVDERADTVLVFSYGYFDEIRSSLGAMGYEADQLVSVIDVMKGARRG
jgi:SAM-dependent methyltransferase